MSSQSDDPETVTVSLTADETTDELTLSRDLLDLLRENDEPLAEVVGDMTVLSLAQQAHGAVHHSHNDVSDGVAAAEQHTMALFEERFGQSYAEMAGHDH